MEFGADLTIFWAIPFMGLLLCIALFPLFAPTFWHHHDGKITAAWSLLTASALLIYGGLGFAIHHIMETMVDHYIPFIILISALFVIGGGVHIVIRGKASPFMNVSYLGVGSVLASLIGTTGASMLLIRPLLSINHFRKNKTHVVVFFIFIVSNIGGLLTPLGDPPLFLGFLNGVSFFWPTINLLMPFVLVTCCVLVIFWAVDHYYFYHDPKIPDPAHTEGQARIRVTGVLNIYLLGAVIIVVILSGLFASQAFVTIAGIQLDFANVIRDIILVGIIFLSWTQTPPNIHEENRFTWEPLFEVAKLFVGIFITIIPVVAILKSGENGALGWIVSTVNPGGYPNEFLYFWATGLLSAFLDNAPTYLVFFNSAGGEADLLTGPLSLTLAAISTGAVVMGALTYIGNAPNFMVRSIAVRSHVRMPGFFGYMAWSFIVLLPVFALLSFVMFWGKH